MKYDFVHTRYVLIEKFSFVDAFQKKLYTSLIKSRENGNVEEDFIDCISEMIEKILKQFNINVETMGEMFHIGIAPCLSGYKNYKDDGNYKNCYKYFSILIYHGLFSNA